MRKSELEPQDQSPDVWMWVLVRHLRVGEAKAQPHGGRRPETDTQRVGEG